MKNAPTVWTEEKYIELIKDMHQTMYKGFTVWEVYMETGIPIDRRDMWNDLAEVFDDKYSMRLKSLSWNSVARRCIDSVYGSIKVARAEWFEKRAASRQP